MLFSFVTKWAVKRLLKKRTGGGFRSVEETQRVVLLAQGKDMGGIVAGIQELVECGLKVTLVVESRHKHNIPVAIPGCYPILRVRKNWLLNRPTNEFLQSFDNNDGDVLLDISTDRSLSLAYLVARSRAEFKIGVPKEEDNSFDLQILMPKPVSHEVTDDEPSDAKKSDRNSVNLLQDALFYWKKIGAKENNL